MISESNMLFLFGLLYNISNSSDLSALGNTCFLASEEKAAQSLMFCSGLAFPPSLSRGPAITDSLTECVQLAELLKM